MGPPKLSQAPQRPGAALLLQHGCRLLLQGSMVRGLVRGLVLQHAGNIASIHALPTGERHSGVSMPALGHDGGQCCHEQCCQVRIFDGIAGLTLGCWHASKLCLLATGSTLAHLTGCTNQVQ